MVVTLCQLNVDDRSLVECQTGKEMGAGASNTPWRPFAKLLQDPFLLKPLVKSTYVDEEK